MKKCTCFYKAGCGRTLGVPRLWVAPEGAGVSHICVYLLPPPFPPHPPRTSSALPPSECTHTPIPWGNSELTFAIFPHPWRRGQGSARPSPLQLFAPRGQTERTLLCVGRVRGGVSSSYHCCSHRKWNSSSSRSLPDGMRTGSG